MRNPPQLRFTRDVEGVSVEERLGQVQREIETKLNPFLRQLGAGIKRLDRGVRTDQSETPTSDDQLDDFFYLPGRFRGQVGHGATEASGTLTLVSTKSTTKGKILLGTAAASAWDETNNRFGLKTASPTAVLEVRGEPASVTNLLPADRSSGSPTLLETNPSSWSRTSELGTANSFYYSALDQDPAAINLSHFVITQALMGSSPAFVAMAVGTDPGVDSGFVLKIHAKSDTGSLRFSFKLFQNFSTPADITTSNEIVLGTSPTTYSYALTNGECAAITLWNQLGIQIGPRISGLGQGTFYAAWLELPGGGGSAGADAKTVIIRANALQTATATEWQNSSGTSLLTVTAAGRLTVESGGTMRFVPSAGTNKILVSNSTGDLTLQNPTLFQSIFSDVTGTPATGDLIFRNGSSQWTRLAIGTAGQALVVSGGLPVWGIPVSGGGWTDDGTVVRLTTATDVVSIGHAANLARLSVVNAGATTDVVLLLRAIAAQTGAMISVQNSSARNLMSLTGATIDLGNATDVSTSAIITFGQNNGASTGPTHTKLNWGQNVNNLSAPATTADQIGVAGARLYTYKDSGGTFDNAYGQSATEAWVLASPASIPYAIYTGRHPSAPFKRVEWSGDGDMQNYGRIAIKKSGGPTPSTPELRLEETGAGTNFTALRASSAITTDHTYIFPAAVADGIFNVSVSGSTGTLSMLTATRGALIVGSATPAWAVLAVGAANTVVKSDGTDTTFGTIDHNFIDNRTRSLFIYPSMMGSVSGAPTLAFQGASPDHVHMWTMATGAADRIIGGTVTLPADWTSGTVEVFLLWTTTGGAGDVSGFYVDFNMGALVTAANPVTSASAAVAADQLLPTTNPRDATLSETSLGTFSTSIAANRFMKFEFKRDILNEIAVNLAANLQTLGIVGFRFTYTADM